MVGLVIVSHSRMLAMGVAELLAQMAPDLPVRAAGGMHDGALGTSADKVYEAIVALDNPDGVLILVDLGSAVMSAEVALERLCEEQRQRVVISDAPLVEGAVVVATNAALHLPLMEVAAAARQAYRFPKLIGSDSADQSGQVEATQGSATAQGGGNDPKPEDEHGLGDAAVVLPNQRGLHARAAAALVKTVAVFESIVSLQANGRTANARSLVEVLRLGARRGDAVHVQTRGRDAASALREITRLMNDGFGEGE